MEASDPEIPGCFDVNRGIGYCCSKRLASFRSSVHPGSPRLDLKCSGVAETRSGLSPSLGRGRGTVTIVLSVPEHWKETAERVEPRTSESSPDLRRHRGMPRPFSCRHFKFEEEQNGEGKEEGLRAGKGPARLAHIGSLALLRAVVLTLGV